MTLDIHHTYQCASVMRLKNHTLLYSSSVAKVQLLEVPSSSVGAKSKSQPPHFHLDGSSFQFIGN